ncbi:carbohydrate ABC transporter substrate-binding protein, partial [Thermococci archaeon]
MKKAVGILAALLLAVAVFASGCIGGGGPTKIVWASTQLNPPEERAFVLNELIPPFKDKTSIDVDFIPISYSDLATRLEGEEQSGQVTIDVVADLHGGLDYFNAKGWLTDLSDKVKTLQGRTFIESYMNYATDR